ncbi:MAG: S46 family peptidase, partial [Bacteroidetes bacterium]|nr:S46 family peptidase [Bacteroidota bacterium]
QKEALERRLGGLLESVNTFKTNLFDLNTVTDQSWPNAYPHEREMLISICQMMYKKHKKESHPAFLTAMYAGDGDDLTEIENAVNAILDKSFIYNQKKFDKMMAKFKASKVLKDPFVQLCDNIYNTYQALAQQSGAAYKDLSKHRRLYFEALMKMKSDKSFYPDANSSMRLTYGTIIPYQPRDGVFYTYKTSHHGVLEKNNPNDPEFQNSDRTLDMFKNHKFGRYGVNDSLTLCFLTNHDITGGNSGSPVINGKGHLIGIAFDGNWEAATSDFLVMPTYNRTISVDIRYVLWVIDEFADCNRLIKEMKVIEPAAKPNKAESNGVQAPAPSR